MVVPLGLLHHIPGIYMIRRSHMPAKSSIAMQGHALGLCVRQSLAVGTEVFIILHSDRKDAERRKRQVFGQAQRRAPPNFEQHLESKISGPPSTKNIRLYNFPIWEKVDRPQRNS